MVFPDTPIERIVLSPDDHTVAVTVRTVFRDDWRKYAIELRNLRTGQGPEPHWLPEKNIFGFSFSADGKWLASSGDALHLWDTVSAKERRLPAQLPEPTQAVCLTPDGMAIATVEWPPPPGSRPQFPRPPVKPLQQLLIQIWSVNTGKVQTTLPGVFGRSNACLSFSADGDTLVSVGNVDVVRVWDVGRVRERCLIPRIGRYQMVQAVVLTPDGRLAAVADDGSTVIRLFETVTGQPIGVLRVIKARSCLWP